MDSPQTWKTSGRGACNADSGPAEGSGQRDLVARATGKAQLALRGDGEPWAGQGLERGHHGRVLTKLGHLGLGWAVLLSHLGPFLIAELSPLCVSKIQGPPASASHPKGS